MMIDNDIFESYLHCKYKAYLKRSGDFGNKSEYEITQSEIRELYKRGALKSVLSEYKEREIFNNPESNCAIEEGKKIIANAYISYNGLQSYCDFMEKISGKSGLGTFHYIPVLFVEKERLSKEDKLMMAYNGLVIGKIQDREPEHGKIVYGKQFKTSKIRLDGKLDIVTKFINELRECCTNGNPPQLILNRHCQVCEFKNSCRAKAIEKDDLSLLCGISTKEIEAQNNKGIFTVTQYSYTFRPRRKFRKSYPFSLKALAIREKKIHLYGTPEIPIANIQVYLDVEGDPEKDFYYLIGIIIIQNDTEKQYTFWADNQDQEKDIFAQFLAVFNDYSEFSLYHYGSYETKFLQKIQKSIDKDDIEIFNKIIENSVNVLSIIYSHFFFPTYSNGLKDIGTYLGFKWSSEDASGIQSLAWRKRWEISKNEELKENLIKYNLEDCLVLKRITELICKIITGNISKENHTNFADVVYAEDLKTTSNSKFGRVTFLFKDLEFINQRAYFDYQREKIFIRTNKILKYAKPHCRNEQERSYNISKYIEIETIGECPCCGRKPSNHRRCSKEVLDLKFSKSGVKRWIVVYLTMRKRCQRCGITFSSSNFRKMPKYGHDLMAWVVYHNIANHQPFAKLYNNLDDMFGLSVNVSTLHRFKKIAAKYYKNTYQNIIDKILQSNIIHIDETQVTIKGKIGYVWVFTNMEEVYLLYTRTREGDFLKELLKNFKGVLISDFYTTYDSIDCPQQKCLIHLIRDLNDDLLKSPFDEEYKNMVSDFSVLARRIIETVDKYGLKKRNLHKHKKEVMRYFGDVLNCSYKSELAQRYQKRFSKTKDKLFTFLDFDGVPWNNNNAEHAIKHFADYRRNLRAKAQKGD